MLSMSLYQITTLANRRIRDQQLHLKLKYFRFLPEIDDKEIQYRKDLLCNKYVVVRKNEIFIPCNFIRQINLVKFFSKKLHTFTELFLKEWWQCGKTRNSLSLKKRFVKSTIQRYLVISLVKHLHSQFFCEKL